MSSTLKKLLNQTPTGDDIKALAKSLSTDSERSAPIVAAAMLDDVLGKALRTKMIKLTKEEDDRLFKGYGPLATFSTKIQMGYATGIYGRKTRHDLQIMNSIRNLFAHATLVVTFEITEVKSACKSFHCLADISDADNHSSQKIFATITKILLIHLLGKIDPTAVTDVALESLD